MLLKRNIFHRNQIIKESGKIGKIKEGFLGLANTTIIYVASQADVSVLPHTIAFFKNSVIRELELKRSKKTG